MRLLRLDNACSAECQQLLYSTESAWSVCIRYDRTLVVVLFISKCAQGMCSLVWKFIVVISSTCMFG